jgi:hypothetical protein
MSGQFPPRKSGSITHKWLLCSHAWCIPP